MSTDTVPTVKVQPRKTIKTPTQDRNTAPPTPENRRHCVQVGDPIIFIRDMNQPEIHYPAIVTGVGLREEMVDGEKREYVATINCAIISSQLRDFNHADGVLHISDPRLQTSEELRMRGVWDFSPIMRRVFRLEDELMKG